MSNSDNIIVALIFTLFCALLQFSMETNKYNQLEKELKQMHYHTVEQNQESFQKSLLIMKLEQELELVNEELEYQKALTGIKEYLRDYSKKDQALALALAWTESTWNYDAKHSSTAEGICGIKPEHWQEYLDSINVELNSLEACLAVYKTYEKKHNNSKFHMLKDYKGIRAKKNIPLVLKTIKIKNIILKELENVK